MKTVLVLSPHTDDAEFGCGGTIAKFIEQNDDVHYIAFSAAEKSVPIGFPKDILRTECMKSTKILGLKNISILDFEVREFPTVRQDILEKLVVLKKELNPDTVIIPSLKDLHQDHHVIAMEALRAFKETASTIIGYEEPWNYITFDNTFFVQLEKKHIDLKIEALHQYKTQTHRSYLNDDFIRSLAKVRGIQIGSNFAEAFEVVKMVIR